jgi:hypothetical protein
MHGRTTMAQGGSRVDATETGDDRATVADIDFLGDLTFPTESFFRGTQVGGLSSVTYDAAKDVFYVVSDDRSQQSPARFYTAKLDLDDGTLDEGDIRLTGVTFLERADGSPYPPLRRSGSIRRASPSTATATSGSPRRARRRRCRAAPRSRPRSASTRRTARCSRRCRWTTSSCPPRTGPRACATTSPSSR